MTTHSFSVDVIDVSTADYAERLTATSLQGIVNRESPTVYLNYGIYDDPSTRVTNEVFLDDEIWFEKYRDAIGNQDMHNLEYYETRYDLSINREVELLPTILKHLGKFDGIVVWDPEFPDTINIALMMSGVYNLLIVSPDRLEEIMKKTGLDLVEDLRDRWKNRIDLYNWALDYLFPKCQPGVVACLEPEWSRPEFTDYIVKNRVFVYSLATLAKGPIFSLGQKLLMLLVGGPYHLREFLFTLGLNHPIKKFGLFLMGTGSKETQLATRLLRAVKSASYPTIFGWHTSRDDEFSFMLHLSANNLRLVPSHLATNFSFHSQLPSSGEFSQNHLSPESIALEEDKTYLTFTLSDGDQLVLMDTAELGNWRRPERGKIPFNWETQPLLAELAPALLEYYYRTKSPNDCLIAGPSGAGYIVPPLLSNLEDYLVQTAKTCGQADVRVITAYIGDPTQGVIDKYCQSPGNFFGCLGGYVHFGRTPMSASNGRAFVANAWPHLDHVRDSAEDTLSGVKAILDQPGPTPRFIGVHLFAYNTTITDVFNFVQSLDPARVKVVRGDEFLLAAGQYLDQK